MKSRIKSWLAAILTLGAAHVARAETIIAPSLEWLTCSAEAIVIGKISKIAATPGPGAVTYEDCLVDLEKAVKGKFDGKQITFTLRRVGANPTAQQMLKSKQGVLLFLAKSKDHGSEKHLDDKWVPTTRVSIFDLAKPSENAYSKDMKIIGDRKELLRIVGDWVASPVKHALWLEVPLGSPIFSKLWGGSAVYLMVPAEEKYRARYMKLARSKAAYDRAQAAGELWKFPGEETEAVLRELLKDDAESFGHCAQDQIASVSYYVRAAAHYSLKALGKPVPEIALERKPTPEEQRKLRVKCWSDSFTRALKNGWSVSIHDGPTRLLDGRENTIVIVTCRREKQQVKFTLVPKYWPANDRPNDEYLGINGVKSQGSRRFYLQGELPGDVKREVVRYFGLEK